MTADAETLHQLQVVAQRLGISVRQVRRLIATHELRAVRLGHRTLRVRDADLNDFICRRGTLPSA